MRRDLWLDNLTTGTSQFVRDSTLTETFWVSPTELPLGTYRAWIRGIDALGLPARWATHVEFLVMDPPEVTSPLQPTFDRRPTFEWEQVTGAEHYEVIIRDRHTGATVYHETQLLQNQWTPPADLPDGRYLWWALAVGENGFRSFWSPTTALYIGGRTELLTPAGSTSSTTPTFTWTPVTGAVSYQLFVDRTDVPSSGIINLTGLTEPCYTPTVPLPVGTYRAWVRAVSGSGELSLWSVQHTFAIVAAAVDTEHENETELDQLMIEFASTDFTLDGRGKAIRETAVKNGRMRTIEDNRSTVEQLSSIARTSAFKH